MSTKKICIIEDDNMLQGVLIERLTEEGFVVSGFSDASTALKSLEHNKPDLILTDLVLLNIDGFEILRTVKESMDLNDIPVMILSNLGEDSDVKKALSLGAVDFLIKSNFSLEEIVTRVKKFIKENKVSAK